MGKVIDVTGQKFNRLTAIKHVEGTLWLFRCDCGNEIIKIKSRVKNGNTKSCGCYYSEKSREIIQRYNNTLPKVNEYEIENGVVTMTTRKGQTFTFDEIDLPIVVGRLWNVDKEGYVRSGGGGSVKRLHREILKTKNKVDHINGNPKDNRRCNLREVTDSQNAMNRALPNNNTTGVKGVTKHKDGGFVVRIGFNGKRIYVGYYQTLEDATQARIEKEKELYKDYMRG